MYQNNTIFHYHILNFIFILNTIVINSFITGNHERAWNDPPVFAYQPTAGGPPKADESGTGSTAVTSKRTFLNKRVAFPMGASSTTSPLPPGSAPPLIGSLPPTLPPPNAQLPPLLPPVTIAKLPTASSDPQRDREGEESASELAKVTNALDARKDVVVADKAEDVNKRLQVYQQRRATLQRLLKVVF